MNFQRTDIPYLVKFSFIMYSNTLTIIKRKNPVHSPVALHLLAGLIFVGCPNRHYRRPTVVFRPDCPGANVSGVYSAGDVYAKGKRERDIK